MRPSELISLHVGTPFRAFTLDTTSLLKDKMLLSNIIILSLDCVLWVWAAVRFAGFPFQRQPPHKPLVVTGAVSHGDTHLKPGDVAIKVMREVRGAV